MWLLCNATLLQAVMHLLKVKIAMMCSYHVLCRHIVSFNCLSLNLSLNVVDDLRLQKLFC